MTTLDTSVLGPEALDSVLALCNRSRPESLLRSELEGSLFAPDQLLLLQGAPPRQSGPPSRSSLRWIATSAAARTAYSHSATSHTRRLIV